MDEAGRGCWAGPVVAAAVVLPPSWGPAKLNDSKKLSHKRRELLCEEILASALSWGACAVSAPVIDEINILQATLQAMSRSLAKLTPVPDLVLVDGTQAPDIPVTCETIVKGDGTSAAIAAASILAKVFRDRIMKGYDRHFPEYGFRGHKGYGASTHRTAINRHGPCLLHRMSYRPLSLLDQGSLF